MQTLRQARLKWISGEGTGGIISPVRGFQQEEAERQVVNRSSEERAELEINI